MKRVRITLPDWAGGGDPEALLRAASLKTWNRGDGEWDVQPEEAYLQRANTLIDVHHVAGPERATRDFGLLDSAARTETTPVRQHVDPALLARRLAAKPADGDIATSLSQAQLALLVAPTTDVAALAEAQWDALRRTRFIEDASGRPFADAGVHFVTRKHAVSLRMKLAQVSLHLEDDPTGRESYARHVGGGPAFPTSDGLLDGHYLLDAYMGPLLGALSPFIWAIATFRESGAIIYSLGTPIAGASGEASEPLQLLPTQSATSVTPTPSLGAEAPGAALRWWVIALDRMFSVLTDVTVFSTSDGKYNPSAHLHAMLTVEQLLRRVSSIQATHRDVHARRVLFFSALDTLQWLTGRNVETLTKPSLAAKTLVNLRAALPTPAAEVLLPTAERGLSALRAVDAGFGAGTGPIQLPRHDGATEPITRDRATGMYMRLLRNATHGHGGEPKTRTQVTSLLKSHSGSVPHDIGFVAWLWLIDLLNRPADLRATLRARSRA
ncbi:hypothetical protein GCM10027194_08110 [Thalassiella azotivora]